MPRRLCALLCLVALACPLSPGQTPDPAARLVIPEGTEIQLVLRDPLSSKLSEAGDEIVATVRRDVIVEGRRLILQGTEVLGRVTLAQPAGRPLKGGRLHVTFERVRLEGEEQRLSALIKSASDFARDEKVKSDGEGTLNGGKSGGQVLQNVGLAGGLGGLGASIIILASAKENVLGDAGMSAGGAAAGAAVLGGSVVAGVLLTKGKEVRLDPGAIIRLKLERPLAIE
jgi:hypothetical protein